MERPAGLVLFSQFVRMGFCPDCDKDVDLIDDEGETCCSECGVVVSENRAVETVEFISSGGSYSVVGTRVDQHGVVFGNNRPSSLNSIRKARDNIEEVVLNMMMPKSITDAAVKLYKLCLASNWTRGRKVNNVIAALVYSACRLNTPRPLPYMLIDFADHFSINVFELGHTFLTISKCLRLGLRHVDPSIYIPRFTRALDLGAKSPKIGSCASRLIARMSRDWIVTGRRPVGICGAALLIAARLNGFKKTLQEMALLIHMSVSTIKMRLKEFSETPVCDLTPMEFECILDEEDVQSYEPPVIIRSRKQKEKRKNLPVLNPEEIRDKVKDALGIITNEELENIVVNIAGDLSNPSPGDGRNLNPRPPTISEPPRKRQKTILEDYSSQFENLSGSVIEEAETPSDLDTLPESEEVTFSDLDDDEMQTYINTPAQCDIAEIVWQSIYGDEDFSNKSLPPLTQKKPKKPIADTAEEAVEGILASKTNRINPDAIKRLVAASAEKARTRTTSLLDYADL